MLPGFLFRKCYLSSVFSRLIIISKPLEDIFASIVIALLLHVGTCIFIYLFSDYRIDLTYLGHLLLGCCNENLNKELFSNIQAQVYGIIIYNITLWIIACCLGNLARLYVRKFKLDIRSNAFRFSNKWHYILTGESLTFPGRLENFDLSKIDYKTISVIVKTSSNDLILYKGILFNYYLSPTKGLESVVLAYTQYKFLSGQGKGDSDFIECDSTKVLITSEHIITMYLQFISLERIKKNTKKSSVKSIK